VDGAFEKASGSCIIRDSSYNEKECTLRLLQFRGEVKV
jgi:hypothetical protein